MDAGAYRELQQVEDLLAYSIRLSPADFRSMDPVRSMDLYEGYGKYLESLKPK